MFITGTLVIIIINRLIERIVLNVIKFNRSTIILQSSGCLYVLDRVKLIELSVAANNILHNS